MSSSSATPGTPPLSKDRLSVLRDAGPSLPMVSVDQFYEHWLPKVPNLTETTALDIIDVVKRGAAYSRGRWTAFHRDPAHDAEHEDDVFKALVSVVHAIEAAASQCAPYLKATTAFVTSPKEPPRSTERYNKSRPDAYFVYKDPHRWSRSGRACWLDIIATGEFKKNESRHEMQDNLEKALWNMHHTNREDARRQRHFSFTIENRTMRLWYADHATLAASESFDFMDQPDLFIRFVLAFLYAPHESLGFDPTITTDWKGEKRTKPRYLITVQSRTNRRVVKQYKTVKLLSSIGAEALRGRGTRVWTVKEWKNGEMTGPTVVLKDCWIDTDRDVEGVVMTKLKKSARSAQDKKDLAEILLTVVVDGLVIHEDGSINQTVHGDVRDKLIINNPSTLCITRLPSPLHLYTSLDSSSSASGSDAKPRTVAAGDHRDPSDALEAAPKMIVYHEKQRYRIVFEEVCEVLHEITDLQSIIWTLMRACFALRVLHKLGWVHRDISSGNIMQLGQTVKLTDLEYAKQLDKNRDQQPHGVRTGTEDFMAVEVSSQSFHFRKRRLPVLKEDGEDVMQKMRERRLVKGAANTTPKAQPPARPRRKNTVQWFHNPLHDAESIFWLTVDTTYNKDMLCKRQKRALSGPTVSLPHESAANHNERLVQCSNFCRTLFVERTQRYPVMTSPGVFADAVGRIQLHPAASFLGPMLIKMHDALVQGYKKAEKTPSKIDHTCAEAVLDFFGKRFLEAEAHLQTLGFDIEVQSLSNGTKKLPWSYKARLDSYLSSPGSSRASKGKKRTRNESEVDEPAEHSDDDLDIDSHRSKSPRTSLDQSPQSSPARPTRPDRPPPPTSDPPPPAPAAGKPSRHKRRTIVVRAPVQPPSRTLRSQVKKEADLEDLTLPPPSPPALPPNVARARKAKTVAEGRGKAIKDSQVSKAKGSTRKGR